MVSPDRGTGCERLHRLETLTAIREGLASAERGELREAEEVYAELKARYGLSGSDDPSRREQCHRSVGARPASCAGECRPLA